MPNSSPHTLAILLNTDEWSMPLKSVINPSSVGGANILFASQYKILQETKNGEVGYVYKKLSLEDQSNLNHMVFPKSLYWGYESNKNNLIKYLKKRFEFIKIQIVHTPEQLRQVSAQRKIHIQISPCVTPIINGNALGISPSYQYWMASKAFLPEKVFFNNVEYYPFPNGNYAWKNNPELYAGLQLSNFDYGDQIPFLHVLENGLHFVESSSGFVPAMECWFRKGFFHLQANYPLRVMAETCAHEIGHAFSLQHWSTNQRPAPLDEYHPGNEVWQPVMGYSTDDPQYPMWSKGDNSTEKTKYADLEQDDIQFFIRKMIPLKLTGEKALNIYKNITRPQWNFHEYEEKVIKLLSPTSTRRFNNLFRGAGEKLSTRKTRLINTTDVTFPDGLSAIAGLIGFPNDFDVLKIVLKQGSYEISNYFNSPSSGQTSLYLGLEVVKSILEVSKSQLNDLDAKIYEKTFSFPRDADPLVPNPPSRINYECDNDFLSETFPEGSAEGKSFLKLPTRPRFWREGQAPGSKIVVESNSAFGQFNNFRKLSFTVTKTCMIYLIAFGDRHPDSTTGFSSYGSIGEYYINIKENGTTTNLLNILPEVPPPNCYPTEKLKCVLNGAVEDKIFFTQDPEDYTLNFPYDNTSDHPNAKKYKIVINGKLCEIPFLLQGKEYGLNDTIDEPDKKELFAVTSKVPATIGAPRIQEFIIAPEWDLT